MYSKRDRHIELTTSEPTRYWFNGCEVGGTLGRLSKKIEIYSFPLKIDFRLNEK